MNPAHLDLLVESLRRKLAPLDDEGVSRVLLEQAFKIAPEGKCVDSMSLSDGVIQALERQEPKVVAQLPPKFGEFAENFYLTPGLHIIAGLTGHGKTVWAMEWAKYVRGETLMLSLEMSLEDLAFREIAQVSGMSLKDLYRNTLSEAQKKLIASMVPEHLKRIQYRNYGSMDWSQIKVPLERDIQTLKPKLIIIDFIQLLQDSDAEDSRISRIYQELCFNLRARAVREDFAVIILSQLNRDAYMQARKLEGLRQLRYLPIGVESLKESGGIAETADSVSFVVLLGKLVGAGDEFRNQIQISVEKSRTLGKQNPTVFGIDYNTMKFLL